jgi:hypothetical protein
VDIIEHGDYGLIYCHHGCYTIFSGAKKSSFLEKHTATVSWVEEYIILNMEATAGFEIWHHLIRLKGFTIQKTVFVIIISGEPHISQ